jgi:hypothetical protein
VVPPPIIGSANKCIYSIWYLSLLPADDDDDDDDEEEEEEEV